ncbi:hypothetical protein Tsubulata_005978 [Turnera subulata]|uniref:RRM domain-containing protein n=1 Tax=Turnera subulata TaxID=218843 RepID=A0A9Q0JE11_9ROSI|nr:hypothetical protein Tsubulata_005978 [Turnera subulata]
MDSPSRFSRTGMARDSGRVRERVFVGNGVRGRRAWGDREAERDRVSAYRHSLSSRREYGSDRRSVSRRQGSKRPAIGGGSNKPSFFSRWDRDRVQRAIDAGIVESVYVENLPPHWSPIDVFKKFSTLGGVIDVFLPGRPARNGLRYGFVKFVSNGRASKIVEKINGMNSFEGPFIANLARSKVEGKGRAVVRETALHGDSSSGQVRDGFLFSQAVGRSPSSLNPPLVVPVETEKGVAGRKVDGEGVSFRYEPTRDNLDFLQTCAFGVLSDGIEWQVAAEMLLAMSKHCTGVKRLGGSYILVPFQSRKAMIECVEVVKASSQELLDLFKAWEEGDHTTHRLCWLNVTGTPPQAWCEDFFRHIAVRFGRFVRLLNNLSCSDDLAVARIQVLTTHKAPIAITFKTRIGIKVFEISVMEAQGCAPLECDAGFERCNIRAPVGPDNLVANRSVTAESGCCRPMRSRLDQSKKLKAHKGRDGSSEESADPFRIKETIKNMEESAKTVSSAEPEVSRVSESIETGEVHPLRVIERRIINHKIAIYQVNFPPNKDSMDQPLRNTETSNYLLEKVLLGGKRSIASTLSLSILEIKIGKAK